MCLVLKKSASQLNKDFFYVGPLKWQRRQIELGSHDHFLESTKGQLISE